MILIGILTFALLVVVHEFGHYIVARRNGVEVEEFGIGFPPKLYGRQVGETEYTINLIPLGGFVKLKGESDGERGEGTFGAARLWAKTKILLAGVGMNLVAAYVMVLILALTSLPLMLPGQYTIAENQQEVSGGILVAAVEDDSAAAHAGIAVGNQLVSIDNEEVRTPEQLADLTTQLAGEEVDITFVRDGTQVTETVSLGESDEGGQLGVAPIETSTSRYTWAAPVVAMGITLQMVGLVLGALWNILLGIVSGGGGDAAAQLTGPVGIVFLLQNLGSFGFEYLFFLLASISVSLAVFNALPIPALDGGRLALIAGARALKKPLSPELENSIHGLGFILLIGLFILITYVDIQRVF